MNSQTKSNLLFRCSQLGNLVTGSEGLTVIQTAKLAQLRAKLESGKITDNQIAELGYLIEKQGNIKSITKTSESYLKSLWLQNEYGYKEEVMTDEMLKGLLCEQDSLGLVQKVLGGEFRVKNNQTFKNDYIIGTPDIVLKRDDAVEDTKSSYNLRTFTEAELVKLYEWQGQGYMWLTGKKKFRLIYCLVPTPEDLIISQKRKWFYKFGGFEENPHYVEISEQIDRNNDLILEIPPKNRVKVFEFNFDPEKIEVLKAKIGVCREYYNTLSLPEYKA